MNRAASIACLTITLLAAASHSAVASGDQHVSAGDKVRVQFTDGKTVIAEFDRRTNHERLVLRFTGDTSVLIRSVAWNRVVTVVTVNTSPTRRAVRTVSEVRQPTYSDLTVWAFSE